IAPYVLVGFLQATLIVGAGVLMFGVQIVGNLALLAALATLFIATNLAFGYTFSTLAQNQLQAVQMSMMFFLPNMMLSGFIFPFLGMPKWAQMIGECLPLTHFMRIVRAIMLKGSTLGELRYDTLELAALMALAMTIAVTRFRRTLDSRVTLRLSAHALEVGTCQIAIGELNGPNADRVKAKRLIRLCHSRSNLLSCKIQLSFNDVVGCDPRLKGSTDPKSVV